MAGKVNKMLMQAITLAADIATEKTTGNGGIAFILQTLVAAYSNGKAGSLAKHVSAWKAEQDTGELKEQQ